MRGVVEELRLGISFYCVMLVSGQSDVLIYPAKFLSTLSKYELRVLEKSHLASKYAYLYQTYTKREEPNWTFYGKQRKPEGMLP